MKLDYQDIVDQLNCMADTIAFDILVEARASGIRVYGDCHGKCSVVIKGNDTGLVGFWQGQRTDKQGGNLIHLIEVSEGVTHGEAVRIAKSRYLGIGDEYSECDKEKYEKRKAEAQRRAFVRKQDGDREAVEKENKVKEIWSKCLPIKGTLADKYLTNRVCAYDWPTSLRFHPQLYCESTRKTHPALVAAVQNVDRKITAIWRIFLNPDGSNLILEGKKVKMGLGAASGGLVRLSPIEGHLNTGEGLESSLGAWALSGFKGSFSASLSTSGMRGFDLPKNVNRVTLWLDGDRARFDKSTGDLREPAGLSAGQYKKQLLSDNGIDVSLALPPEGMDWLDVWNERNPNDEY